MNIPDAGNYDSGNTEIGILERESPLIGLITFYQAQSRFAGRKPALYGRYFLYPT